MHLVRVLGESLGLLKKEPKVFFPRIITSILYTFFILYLTRIAIEVSFAVNREIGMAESLGTAPDISRALSQFSGELPLFVFFFIITFVSDVLSYGMFVVISRDFHENRKISLIRAFKDSVSRARVLFLVSVLATIFVGFFVGIYLIFGRMYIMTRSPLFLALALAVIALAVILFALVFFFAVPVAMVEDRGAKSAIMKSASLGIKHMRPVLMANLLFFCMMLVVMLALVITKFQGAVAISAIFVFILGRIAQVIIYTYISIVNPSLYLSIEEVER
ncbi:MAG: hypothetical protein V3R86_03850 [Candidatus Hydrothermarchaeaceae archaeon]